MEKVAALGHHPQNLRALVLAEAYRAGGAPGARRLPREGELRVRVDHFLVEADGGALVGTGLLVGVVLRDEYDAGEDDAVGGTGAGVG